MKRIVSILSSVIFYLFALVSTANAGGVACETTNPTEKFIHYFLNLQTYSLDPLIFYFILVPLFLGFFFHRVFIAKVGIWIFAITTIVWLLIVIFNFFTMGRVSRPDASNMIVFQILFVFLTTSFFVSLSFISSAIGSQFKRIREKQQMMNRFNKRSKYIIIGGAFCLAPLFFYALLFINSVFSFDTFPVFIGGQRMIIGELVVILSMPVLLTILSILLFWINRLASRLPKKQLSYTKSDYIFLGIMIVIFAATFLGAKYYPTQFCYAYPCI